MSSDCTIGRGGVYGTDCQGPGTYFCDDVAWGSRCRAWQARNGGYSAPDGIETAEPTDAERLAQRFHEVYEELAPQFGYKTREESAVPWKRVPVRNRRLMIAVAQELIGRGEAP